jgi:hypothetical protein
MKTKNTQNKSSRLNKGPKPSQPPAGDLDLSPASAAKVQGGRVYRITNVRANASALAGGSAAGATPVIAS